MIGEGVKKVCMITAMVFIFTLMFISSVQGQFDQQEPVVQSDLKVEDLEFSDGSPGEDDNMTFNATVRNNGTMPMKNITLVFLVDGMEIGNVSDMALGPKENRTYSISWKAEAGIHNVSAVLKIDGRMLSSSLVSEELTVDPKPVGDIRSLLLSLGMVALLVLLTGLLYSIVQAVRM